MSIEAAAMTGLAAINPALAAGLSVAQGLSAIQNARYQANLIERQAEETQRQAAFTQTDLEITTEKERVNKAMEKNEKLKKARKTIGVNVAAEAASGLVFSGDVFQTVSLRNLSEELSIIRLEEALIQQRLKGQQAQLTSKTEFDKRIAATSAKQIKTAGYFQAAGNFISAYGIGADAGYFDKQTKHLDSGSGANITAGGPGKTYSTTTYGTT